MKKFLSYFVQNNGLWVFLAQGLSKAFFFLMNLWAIRMLSKSDYGTVMLALNFLGFFLALVGMGNYQAVLRFGALEPYTSRKMLFNYLFSIGLVRQGLVNILMLALALVFYWNHIEVFWLILLLSSRFLGFYFLEFSKARRRALLDNKTFAWYDIIFATLSLLLSIIFTYFWGVYGFVLALCIAPFFILFLDRYQCQWALPNKTKQERRDLWQFSWTTALTSQVSGWIFMIDLLMIGWYLTSADVANYRVASILPFNLLFIGHIFLQTDYAKLCKSSKNKQHFQQYLKNYWQVIALFSVLILGIGFWQSQLILSLFGEDYRVVPIFRILLISTILGLMLRMPFGYLLAALGQSHWNLKIAIFINTLTFLGLYFIIPQYGIEGVAYFTLFNIALSGLLTAMAYRVEIQKL
ncbi:oligosaccharide flippase family protein [Riemerella columbina]|uniref:oligosaccharide flippase family protein n=1 Tax=Riemerella columbina TaxID=103810 RepID=UPI00266F14D2|nr:oligosaccharide flippase family protein [Riemerella columbina]WKS95438.1 oligosaccharide flippase family protein [Riemerella columbina]